MLNRNLLVHVLLFNLFDLFILLAAVLNFTFTIFFISLDAVPLTHTTSFLQEDRLSVDEALNHPYFQEPR